MKGVGASAFAVAFLALANGGAVAVAAQTGGEDTSLVVLGGIGPSVLKPIFRDFVPGASATVRLGYAFPSGLVPWVGASGARWYTSTPPSLWEVSGVGGVRQRFLTGSERPWVELTVGYGRFKNEAYTLQPGVRLGAGFGVDWAIADAGWLGVYVGADYSNQLSGIWGPYAWVGAGVSFTVRVHGLPR